LLLAATPCALPAVEAQHEPELKNIVQRAIEATPCSADKYDSAVWFALQEPRLRKLMPDTMLLSRHWWADFRSPQLLACNSGLKAILYAAMQVGSGASDVVIAGGAESMSNAAFYSTAMRWGARGEGFMLHDTLARGRVTAGGRNYPVPGGMIETAENLRREYNIPREEQDEFSYHSHQRAVAAQRNGLFDSVMVPIDVATPKGASTVSLDEHPRADTSVESLAKLKPIMSKDPQATVTAGNSSGQNDGAAACLVTTREHAARFGLRA
jgi:acetyl-CoA C-acetyltransferase